MSDDVIEIDRRTKPSAAAVLDNMLQCGDLQLTCDDG